MENERKQQLEREANNIIANARLLERYDDNELRRIEKAIAQIIEPRRAPNGRIMFVPRGTSFDERSEMDSYLSIRGIMDWKRKAKRSRYLDRLRDPNYRGPKIVGEGDSWLEYPCNKDNGEWIGDEFALLSLAKAGDTWADVINDENGTYDDNTPMGLFRTIAAEKPQIAILSVTGNDVLDKIEQYVKPYQDGLEPKDYLTDDFTYILNYVEHNFRNYTSRLVQAGCQVIVHPYDYPDPRAQNDGGQWIGGPLERARGIPGPTLWRGIVNHMLELYFNRLEKIAAATKGVHVVKLFKTIGNDDIYAGPDRQLWTDEMHGSKEGFRRIAQKFRDKINEIYHR